MASECSKCSPKFTLLEKLRSCNLPQKLRANQYPSISTEKSQLTHFLASGDDELSLYDKEIARLQARIVLLETEKQDLVDDLSFVHSLLSPVRRIPQEILQEVFSWLNRTEGCASIQDSRLPSSRLLHEDYRFLIWIKSFGEEVEFLTITEIAEEWKKSQKV